MHLSLTLVHLVLGLLTLLVWAGALKGFVEKLFSLNEVAEEHFQTSVANCVLFATANILGRLHGDPMDVRNKSIRLPRLRFPSIKFPCPWSHLFPSSAAIHLEHKGIDSLGNASVPRRLIELGNTSTSGARDCHSQLEWEYWPGACLEV